MEKSTNLPSTDELQTVESVGKEFRENFKFNPATLKALKTTPFGTRGLRWLQNRGVEFLHGGLSTMSLDLTSFHQRMRERLWTVLASVTQAKKGEIQQITRGGYLSHEVHRVIFETGTFFGYHTSALFRPRKAEDKRNLSGHVSDDIEVFIRSFGDGIECPNFRFFLENSGNVYGEAFKKDPIVAPEPEAPLIEFDDTPSEAMAKFLADAKSRGFDLTQ